MSKSLITVEADMDIKDTARLMLTKKIRRLPVEKNGWLIGIVNSNARAHTLNLYSL